MIIDWQFVSWYIPGQRHVVLGVMKQFLCNIVTQKLHTRRVLACESIPEKALQTYFREMTAIPLH